MKKIVDEQGRLFGKVSVIDVAVVLIVIVMGVALYMKNNQLSASSTTSASNGTIYFTAQMIQVSDYIIDAIQVGDKVYDADRVSGGAIGEITEIELLPSTQTVGTSQGDFVVATCEDARNVRFTVKCKGSIQDGRYSINRVYQLGVNANRNFYTPYVTLSGVCVIDIYAEGNQQ